MARFGTQLQSKAEHENKGAHCHKSMNKGSNKETDFTRAGNAGLKLEVSTAACGKSPCADPGVKSSACHAPLVQPDQSSRSHCWTGSAAVLKPLKRTMSLQPATAQHINIMPDSQAQMAAVHCLGHCRVQQLHHGLAGA